MSGDSTMNTAIFWHPAQIERLPPGRRDGGAGHAPTSACEEVVGSPRYHVMMSQPMAPTRPAKITGVGERAGLDDVLGDRGRHLRPEDEEGREVEERRPRDRLPRRQHAGRDDGGDGVRGVVEAVEEVEASATAMIARTAIVMRT